MGYTRHCTIRGGEAMMIIGGHALIVDQCSERLLGIIGQNPSVSKFNPLQVVVLQFFFTNLRYIS